jgi:hypothetical protein
VVWCRATAEQLNRSSGAFSGRRQVGAFDHKKRGPKVRNIESVGLVELVLRKARVSRPRVHSASAIATTNRRTGRLGTLSPYCSHRGHRAMSRRLPCPLSNHRRGTHWVAASPFQFEVGTADFAIGVAACVAFGRDLALKVVAICAASIFPLGDAIGHVREMIVGGNFACCDR